MYCWSEPVFAILQCELLVCIAEPDNSPAMSVVRGLLGQYPTITAKVFVGEWATIAEWDH